MNGVVAIAGVVGVIIAIIAIFPRGSNPGLPGGKQATSGLGYCLTATALAASSATPIVNSSGMFGFYLEHTHFNFNERQVSVTNVSHLGKYWTALTQDKIYSSPVASQGIVYVGSLDKKLYAFDAATGRVLWSTSTDGEIYSSPTIANGVIYIGSQDHNLYAFHLLC